MDFLSKTDSEETQEAPPVEYIIETQSGIVVRDPFDAQPLIALFEKFHVEIDRLSNQAQGLQVVDDETNSTAILMTNQSKTLANTIEKKRVELKEPYLRVTNVLDSETKSLKDRLILIQKHINSLITPFLQKKEAARRETERKAQAERDRIQRELDEKARKEREVAAEEARKKAEAEGLSKKKQEEAARNAAALVEDAPIAVFDAPQETKVSTDAGSAKIKEEFIGTLVDIRLIDDDCINVRWNELVKAVQPYVNAQIASGKRTVPGFKIEKVVKLETRAAKRGSSQGKW